MRYLTLTHISIVCFISFATALLVNRHVDFVYMDEIFHVGQAKNYCAGHFRTYDPKLTTPPGLYGLSLTILGPLLVFFNPNAICSLFGLRVSNLSLSLVLLLLLRSILQRHGSPCAVSHHAINLVFFPVLYFFNFLYYTDVASLLAVIALFKASSANSAAAKVLLGIFAITVRQTNVIWIGFFAGLEAYNSACAIFERDVDLPKDRNSLSYALAIIQRFVYSLIRLESKTFPVLFQLFPYIVHVALFASFVLINGSIVLGEKEAHAVSLHCAQIGYFVAFTCAFGFPILLPYVKRLFRMQYLFSILFLSAVFAVLVHCGTIYHPYLLADNRHYTFYLRTKILSRTWYSRYVLCPLYAVGTVLLWISLNRQHFVWKFGFTLCTSACLVPAQLIEFRYFLISYVLWRIHASSGTKSWQLLLEFCLFLIVNCLTLYMFLYMPFKWHDNSSLQRFMW